MARRLPYALLVAIVLLSAGLHAHRAMNPTSSYQSADERSYGKLAVSLANVGQYGPPSTGMRDPLHWPPGAPVLFAAGHELFPSAGSVASRDIPAAYWLLAIVSTLTTLLAALLARVLAGPWAGLATAASRSANRLRLNWRAGRPGRPARGDGPPPREEGRAW